MFIVLLKFSGNKERAAALMPAHKEWLQRGFDDGVFLLTGSIQPSLGGTIIVHGLARGDLNTRLAQDPFVAEGVVTLEILDIAPSRLDKRLSFLAG
ncbi:MAG: YciI family protein [Parvibaculaceae bacterium]